MCETFDREIGDLSERFEQTVKHQMGVLSEDFQYKLDIVAEGQQMLSEKLEMTRQELKTDIHSLDQRLTVVEAKLVKKLDAVVADLSAHRTDTEAHHGVYRVKDGV
jgi:hypothetical protein